MLKKCTFLLMLFVAIVFSTNAQTGFSEDYNSGTLSTNWFVSPSYTLSQADGVMKVSVNKSEGWASYGRSLSTIDVSSNPIVNFKVKSAQDITVDMYLVDANNKNYNIGKRISRANDYINVCWDFTGVTAVDLTQISQIYVAINGMALTYVGDVFFDDLKIGTEATKFSNFSGVAPVSAYVGSTNNTIYLQGISNAQSIQFSPTPSSISNITYSSIVNNRMTITYDAGPNAGTEAVTLVSTPTSGWNANSFTFNLNVEDNNPPVFTIPSTFKCKVGEQQTIDISDISDGNKTAAQSINFTLTSSNGAVIGNNEYFDYVFDSSIGKLIFTPTAAGTVTATITANDGQSANNVTSKDITITSYTDWNASPTIDDVSSFAVYNNAGEQTVTLSGISAGTDESQSLNFVVTSTNSGVINTPTVTYTSRTTAELKFTPIANTNGLDTITITLTDNGGTENNNGNQSASISFEVDIQNPPLTGYEIPFTDYVSDRANKLWHVESETTGQTISYENDGTDDMLHINCTAKSTWTGLWYGFNNQKLDLSQNPYITMWVKSDNDIQFTLYFWDYKYERNNIVSTEFKSIPANTWTKVTFDFYGKMVNDKSLPIASDKIDSLLFNYHPVFSWPFTNFAGNVWIKDVRIGDKADGVFEHPKVCTIDDIAAISAYSNSTGSSIELTNITDGNNGASPVTVTATSSNTAVVASPVVSEVTNGNATLTYSLTGSTGSSTITVTTTASGSTSTVKTFVITVVDANPSAPATVTIDMNTKYQTMRGIGTFLNPVTKSYTNEYVNDFGGTVARVGVISNHLEPVNDNDDPYVLDKTNLDYSAFDWEFLKQLKKNGVENFILTVWSMPAWMKENASDDYFMASATYWDGTTNRVDTLMYEEYVENIVATIKAFKEKADIDLYGISLQNEPAFSEPYASAVLSPKLMVKLINMTGRRFAQEGINCRIYMAEQVLEMPVYSWSQYLTAIQNDDEAWKYSDVQAVHGYAANGITAYTANCSQWDGYKTLVTAAPHPKEFWMTETEPVTSTWTTILNNVLAINTAFSCGNVSLWSQWGFDSHFITNGKSNQLAFAQSQFAKFVKPEAVRVSSTSSDANLVVTSYANDADHGKSLATVVINKSSSPISIKLTGTNIPDSYDVYETYALQNFKQTLNGAQKNVSYLLQPYSITTFNAELSNAAPTIDAIPDQVLNKNSGEQVITLSGITDGGEGGQVLTVTPVVSSGSSIVTNVRVEYNSPENTAKLYFTPVTDQSGNAVINVTVTDDATANNTTTVACNIQVKNVTGLSKVTDNGLKLYPNPANEQLNISLPDNTYTSVKLVNMMGEIVKLETISGRTVHLNVDTLNRGIYFIIVKSDNGSVLTKQFIKQ